jgi:glycosyltransferase involved in cell wall biosynthesis
MDTWVIQPNNIQPIPWVAYFPVDHDPMPPKVKESILFANARIAMSKFGLEQAHKMGMDSYYVPHAVDTNLYKVIDKKEARDKLKLPQDAWVIGTVAMNKGQPSRKNFTQMLEAFRNFKRRHTDAIYYLHTQLGQGQDGLQGVNLPELCELLGLRVGKDVFFCDQYNQVIGFNEEYMALMYSSLDVHMLVSAGEGFGIPIIESQSCGCPNIVGGWTAMPELLYSGHIIDRKDAEAEWTGIASYNFRPHVRAIELALEAEYKKPSPRDRARKGMVENYDVELVVEKHWGPVLATIETKLAEMRARFKKVSDERDVNNGK